MIATLELKNRHTAFRASQAGVLSVLNRVNLEKDGGKKITIFRFILAHSGNGEDFLEIDFECVCSLI